LYKAHNATPQHDIFKTPEQASQNPSNFGDKWKYLCSNGDRKKLSWSVLRFCQRRSATIACPGDVLHAQKTKKRNDDEAHPGTGATSGHSRRRMQPNQKHNDNANRVLAVNFNHRRNQKKTARSTCTHWALLSVDMLPKIAHACSFMGLEKGLDLG